MLIILHGIKSWSMVATSYNWHANHTTTVSYKNLPGAAGCG